VALLMFIPAFSLAAFSDVPDDHNNYEAVDYLRTNNVIQGYRDDTFRPNNQINRAEFTKIVIESQFSASQINNCRTSQFSDVAVSAWFAPYICLAQQKQIVSGYDDGTFRPAENIVFVEAAKIIAETLNLPTEDLKPWYAPYAQVLSDRKAIPLTIDSPTKLITRGEMAEMIFRLETDNQRKSGTRFTFKSIAAEREEPTPIETGDQIQVVLNLVNQARTDLGLNPLTINNTLQNVAQRFAEQMDGEDFFDHIDPQGLTPSDRVTAAGYRWRSTGENIAKGQETGQDVFDTWKNSPGHWKNIINPGYEEIGIGQTKVTNNSFFRGFVWVQVFGTQQ